MNDDEQQPTPEEMAEAAALGRALETSATTGAGAGNGAPPAPAPLLEAAALLRHAAPERLAAATQESQRHLDAALARILPVVDARRARPRRRWFWLAPATLLPAAAAALLLFTLNPRSSPAPQAISISARPALPAPSLALLRAQADATRGGPALAELDRQMRDYRATFYRTLVDRAGGGR